MSCTVLIVEDEPDANDILAQLVASRGFRPVQTYTGRDGLAKAQHAPPDLMLLDLMLPDIDGFMVCEELRTNRETNLVPIVMATALTEREHRLHGFRVGANCYVVKPYTSAQLFKAIDEALEWKAHVVRSQVEGEFSFDLASDTEYLMKVNDLIASLLLTTPLESRAVAHLRTALHEIGQNAIEWGNKKQVDKVVKITYRIHPDRVTFTIKDQGEGFDPTNVPHAAQEEDPIAHFSIREVLGIREGGFGILMSRGLVDDLKYNEVGNEVTFSKRFPPARPPAN